MHRDAPFSNNTKQVQIARETFRVPFLLLHCMCEHKCVSQLPCIDEESFPLLGGRESKAEAQQFCKRTITHGMPVSFIREWGGNQARTQSDPTGSPRVRAARGFLLHRFRISCSSGLVLCAREVPSCHAHLPSTNINEGRVTCFSIHATPKRSRHLPRSASPGRKMFTFAELIEQPVFGAKCVCVWCVCVHACVGVTHTHTHTHLRTRSCPDSGTEKRTARLTCCSTAARRSSSLRRSSSSSCRIRRSY